jgi:hypothetical protein
MDLNVQHSALIKGVCIVINKKIFFFNENSCNFMFLSKQTKRHNRARWVSV